MHQICFADFLVSGLVWPGLRSGSGAGHAIMTFPTSPIGQHYFVNGNSRPSGHADGSGPHGGHDGHGGHSEGDGGGQHVHLLRHHSPEIEKMAPMQIDRQNEVGTCTE